MMCAWWYWTYCRILIMAPSSSYNHPLTSKEKFTQGFLRPKVSKFVITIMLEKLVQLKNRALNQQLIQVIFVIWSDSKNKFLPQRVLMYYNGRQEKALYATYKKYIFAIAMKLRENCGN